VLCRHETNTQVRQGARKEQKALRRQTHQTLREHKQLPTRGGLIELEPNLCCTLGVGDVECIDHTLQCRARILRGWALWIIDKVEVLT
jgi:hypothetical protein